MGTKIDRQIDDAIDEIQQLADDIRVRLHLASMDARDKWHALEPKIEAAREHARAAKKDSMKVLDDVRAAMKSFRAGL